MTSDRGITRRGATAAIAAGGGALLWSTPPMAAAQGAHGAHAAGRHGAARARTLPPAAAASPAVAPESGPAAPPPAVADSFLGYHARLRTLLDAPPGDGFQPEVEAQILACSNGFREENGLSALLPHPGLERAARAAVADMASRGFFDHRSPEGRLPSERVGLLARELCGVSGENIAFVEGGDAAPDGRSFFEQWRDSPGHRANLLRAAYTHAGHGVLRIGARTYAAAAFASEEARLLAEPPLSLPAGGLLGDAVIAAAPRFERFQLQPAEGGGLSPVMTLADAPALPPGAWRLRPHLPSGPNRFTVLWGPIFIA